MRLETGWWVDLVNERRAKVNPPEHGILSISKVVQNSIRALETKSQTLLPRDIEPLHLLGNRQRGKRDMEFYASIPRIPLTSKEMSWQAR
jgi:hypothetical protein